MHLEYKDSGIAEAQNKTIKDLKLCGKGTLNGSGKVQQIGWFLVLKFKISKLDPLLYAKVKNSNFKDC